MNRSLWGLLAAAGAGLFYIGAVMATQRWLRRAQTLSQVRRLAPAGEDPLRRLRQTWFVRRVERDLDRSRLAWDPALVWLARAGGGLLLGGVIQALFQADYLIALPLGWWLVSLLLRWYFVRARKLVLTGLINQLPDVARSLAHATRAGATISQALSACAREIPDPAGAILRECVNRLDLGQPLPDALQSVTSRLESTDLHLLTMTLIVQHRLGGNLPEALLTLAQTQEERIQSAHETQAFLASTRSSALILPWTPWLVALLCNAVMPGFLLPLLSGWGIALMVVVGIFQAAGILLVVAMTPGEV